MSRGISTKAWLYKEGKIPKWPGGSKYKNVPTEIDGHTFASKKEALRYAELLLLSKARDISNLELQPSFPLVVNGEKVTTYRADFRYLSRDGKVVVEDTKGIRTPVYSIKKKLMKAVYGIEVKET